MARERRETPKGPPAHRETLRVRYSDTDAQGIAHHSSYILWLEEARLGWLRAIDLGYADLTASGIFLSLVECACRYVSPAKGEDLVTVDVWVVEISRLRVRLRYEIRRGRHPARHGFHPERLRRRGRQSPAAARRSPRMAAAAGAVSGALGQSRRDACPGAFGGS